MELKEIGGELAYWYKKMDQAKQDYKLLEIYGLTAEDTEQQEKYKLAMEAATEMVAMLHDKARSLV